MRERRVERGAGVKEGRKERVRERRVERGWERGKRGWKGVGRE